MQDNKIIYSPSLLVIPPRLITYLDNKAELFIKKKLSSANHKEQIGLLTGYNTISTNANCGGYCDLWKKEIAINDNSNCIHTILHECSHAFQADFGIWEKLNPLISDYFKAEQQCESMAAYIYEKIYKKPSIGLFNAYMDNDSLLFLQNWYKGSCIENDIKNI